MFLILNPYYYFIKLITRVADKGELYSLELEEVVGNEKSSQHCSVIVTL